MACVIFAGWLLPYQLQQKPAFKKNSVAFGWKPVPKKTRSRIAGSQLKRRGGAGKGRPKSLPHRLAILCQETRCIICSYFFIIHSSRFTPTVQAKSYKGKQ